MDIHSGEALKVPVIAGVAVVLAQGVAQSSSVISLDRLTEILLGAIAGMLLYVVRETHRHSICLFGLKDDPENAGLSGDIRNLKEWKEKTTMDLHDISREAAEVLAELKQHNNRNPRGRA